MADRSRRRRRSSDPGPDPRPGRRDRRRGRPLPDRRPRRRPALRPTHGPSRAGLDYAPSLLPIAVGYAVAHYFSLLMFDGQTTFILASDPFETRLNLLGLTGYGVDYTVVSDRVISLVQVGSSPFWPQQRQRAPPSSTSRSQWSTRSTTAAPTSSPSLDSKSSARPPIRAEVRLRRASRVVLTSRDRAGSRGDHGDLIPMHMMPERCSHDRVPDGSSLQLSVGRRTIPIRGRTRRGSGRFRRRSRP